MAEQNGQRTFNPNEHLMQLKSKQGSQDYLPVQWRLVWFRERYPQGTIETEMILLDLDRDTYEEVFVWNPEKRKSEKVVKTAKGLAIFRAIVKDGIGGVATGTKSEKAASFPDFIEKAETGSVGRALAALGYGTQFAPDLDEQHRIVDAGVDRDGATGNGNATDDIDHASPQQLASIRKLCERIDKPEPANLASLNDAEARTLIQQLTAEYRETRSQPPQPAKSANEQRTALILDNGPLDDPMVEARKDVLNAIYNDGKRRGLWTSTNAMAVYMTTALKRPADQPVLPSHLPNLSNDEIALVKSAVEAVKPATTGAGGVR